MVMYESCESVNVELLRVLVCQCDDKYVSKCVELVDFETEFHDCKSSHVMVRTHLHTNAPSLALHTLLA